MGSCLCEVGTRPTSTNYGGTLNFTWYEGNKRWTWHGPPRYCNPMNCSNSRCKTNGCAQAKKGFCATHGTKMCAGKKICAGEKCLGGATVADCSNTYTEQLLTGRPRCGTPVGDDGTVGGGSKPIVNEPGCRCGCEFPKGSWDRTLNCIGWDAGNFFTDAAKSGSEQMPLLLITGLVAVGILVFALR